jgi:hypothetical protein
VIGAFLAFASPAWSGVKAVGGLVLRSRPLQIALAAGAGLLLLSHFKAEAYRDGLADGRSECRSSALAAQVTALEAQAKASAEIAAKATKRAQEAEKEASARQTQVERAERLAALQANAKGVCLTKETADAIRAIR